MCPACLMSAALIAGGTAAGGGTVAWVARRVLRRRTGKPAQGDTSTRPRFGRDKSER